VSGLGLESVGIDTSADAIKIDQARAFAALEL
jgi:hypothetical protein